MAVESIASQWMHGDGTVISMPDFVNLPKTFRDRLQRATPEAREAWQADRLRAMSEPFYLGTEVLGMDFQENPHRSLFAQFPRLSSESGKHLYDLSPEIKNFMVLWPRGTFKTSALVVVAASVIVNYPNIRICWLSGAKELAQRQVDRVSSIFTRATTRFLNLFPEFCGEPLKEKGGEFTTSARTSLTFAEPTICTSTAKSVKAGSHFDLMIIDDLVNEQNYRSIEMLEKCWQDYIDLGPLREVRGFTLVGGTRYSFGDTYERIQEKAKEEENKVGRKTWHFSIRTCWQPLCETCGHYQSEHSDVAFTSRPCEFASCNCQAWQDSGKKDVLFPQFRTADGRELGHTVEWLEEQKRLDPEFFAAQYENHPQGLGEKRFPEWLINRQTIFHLQQIPSPLLANTFFVGDLSYVGDDKRDSSVIDAVRYYNGQLYVFDCIFGKWDSAQVANELINWTWKYRPWIIYLEKFLGWEAYDKVFKMIARDRGLMELPVHWRKMNNQAGAKKIRVGGVKAPLMERRLWLFAGMPGYGILCKQLDRFPKYGKHDDHADTLGHVCEVPSGYDQAPRLGLANHPARRYNAPTDADTGAETNPDAGWPCGSGIICD